MIRCVSRSLLRIRGERAGKTVPQVYVGLEGTGEDRPVKELRGFTKIALDAGERRQVEITLEATRALRYWSNNTDAYAIAPTATVYIGESVQDIRLTGHIN